MTDQDLQRAELAIKKSRKQVKASDLWQRLMENRLTQDDRYLLAALIKRITKSEHSIGIMTFTEKFYYDTYEKDTNF